VPVDDESVFDRAGREPAPDPDAGLLRDERDTGLWRAFARISDRCQRLLRILTAEPPPSYEDVSEALEMPIGSIGPTRQRCLDRLRAELAVEGIVTT
jgi:DNA-directed RNA polymerase specialized sigma24 family protein